MQVPFVLCLNMSDEARERGITIDHSTLGEALGVEVVPTVAVQHQGLLALRAALGRARVGRESVRYSARVESALEELVPLLPPAPIAPRALGVMVLAGDETLVGWLRERMDPEGLAAIEDIRQELRRSVREPLLYLVQRERLRAAREISASFLRRRPSEGDRHRPIAAWLEHASLHPFWSLPLLAGVLFLCYQFVGVFGAGMLVDLLENGFFGKIVNPGATRFVENVLPWPVARDLLVGPYGVLTMALTYALALILPIVGTFFIAFGALEDSGYLPRLAVLLDRAFKKMGLNGKAVLPMVLGLGCGTMATLTTRMLSTSKERLIVIVLLSLGVPCSAQLTVILAMLAALSPAAVAIWLLVLCGLMVAVGSIAARRLP
jgi:ferrous iron transport protein B